MKVSVVVPVYNEEKSIEECLKSLVNQKEKADEIIIVDNNCTDRSIEIAKKYPVKIIKEEKQGIISARNKGFNSAKNEIIARTDADTVVPEDWILQIKKHFEKNNIVALSGPVYYLKTPAPIPAKYQISHLPVIYFFRALRIISKKQALFGPNMALKKSAWKKIKKDICLVDKDVHEDIDLGMHLSKYYSSNIKFDEKLIAYSSPRRWKDIYSTSEYTRRLIKMIKSHKNL